MENSEKKTVSRKVIDREVIMRKYHVHIKNFRNLKDVKVTLSPLTILTGENGSGKSTLFKALLFLKHNHDHEAAKKLKYVIDDDINLGGWEHIANDPKKPISIKITEETWGYDHEVEEIYDIDNCPFELNPTEEYAEQIWKSFHNYYKVSNDNDLTLTLEGKKVPKTRKSNRVTKLKAPSIEFIFQNEKLENLMVESSLDNVVFGIKLYNRPYPKTISQIESLYNSIEIINNYLSIEVLSENKQRSSLMNNMLLNLSLYEFLMHPDFDNNKNNDLINLVDTAYFKQNTFQKNSRFRKYLSFLIWNSLRESEKEHLIFMFTQLDSCFSTLNTFNSAISNIDAISTVREIPKSRYLQEEIKENTYYGIFDFLKRFENNEHIFEAEIIKYIFDRFQIWLLKFNLGRTIFISESNTLAKLKIRTIAGEDINLSEASSGTIQLLPIIDKFIVNGLKSRCLLVQQPELHLHPRLQSLLIELMISTLSPELNPETPTDGGSNSGTSETKLSPRVTLGNRTFFNVFNDINKGKCFHDYTVPTHLIIETHSEHLLKKLQVLVSQGKTLQLWPEGHCSGEDVKLKDALSIYYFAKDKNGNTKAIEMELDDNGFFKTETPKGFFDESLELNRQLLLGRN